MVSTATTSDLDFDEQTILAWLNAEPRVEYKLGEIAEGTGIAPCIVRRLLKALINKTMVKTRVENKGEGRITFYRTLKPEEIRFGTVANTY